MAKRDSGENGAHVTVMILEDTFMLDVKRNRTRQDERNQEGNEERVEPRSRVFEVGAAVT